MQQTPRTSNIAQRWELYKHVLSEQEICISCAEGLL